MRFSDVMLSVGFVGLAAADPLGGYCSEKPNGVLECRLDPTPASTNTCPTAKAHVHTTIHVPIATETVHVPIATTTVPITTATIRAIPTATETRYKLALATPSSGASRRYSVPGLFTLPRRIMGLMAGAQQAAAREATKTVSTITTEKTTVTAGPFSEVTETTPVVVGTVTTTISKKTKTTKEPGFEEFVSTIASAAASIRPLPLPRPPFAALAGVPAGNPVAWTPSDELSTTTFTPVKTETSLKPQPESTETISVTVIETVIETKLTVETTPLTIIKTKSTVETTPLAVSETSTVIGTNTVWVFPTLDVLYHPQQVTVPSLSDEPTITKTGTTTESTTTTSVNTKKVFTPIVRTVTVTSGATQTAQPPKVFSPLRSLLKK